MEQGEGRIVGHVEVAEKVDRRAQATLGLARLAHPEGNDRSLANPPCLNGGERVRWNRLPELPGIPQLAGLDKIQGQIIAADRIEGRIAEPVRLAEALEDPHRRRQVAPRLSTA
ncbi:MAG TPA: hypothetical protein VGG06_02365 [Thermoanaerobaculia bacterium]|jgi:hypothetical protein